MNKKDVRKRWMKLVRVDQLHWAIQQRCKVVIDAFARLTGTTEKAALSIKAFANQVATVYSCEKCGKMLSASPDAGVALWAAEEAAAIDGWRLEPPDHFVCPKCQAVTLAGKLETI